MTYGRKRRKESKMKKYLVPLCILLVCAFLISGCSSPSSTSSSAAVSPSTSSGTPKYGGVLRVIGSASPNTLGWFAQAGLSGSTATGPVVEPLLRCDFYNVVTPWLAENYTIAPDSKSITLNIRKGVKFHDGSTLDAAAVKWNMEQMKAGGITATTKW